MSFTFNPSDEAFSFNPNELGSSKSYIPTCVEQPNKDQLSYNGWLKELISLYGVEIRYYPNKFDTATMNSLFGEDMISGFDTDTTFKAYVEISSNANILSRFGIKVNSEVSVSIPFDTWDQYFPNTEPKSGDIFVVINTGCGRRGDRTAEVFEITERLDRKNPGGDFLGRHYAWFLEAARFEYAYEPGAPKEAEFTDVSDEEIFGRLSGGNNPESPVPAKSYDQNVEAMSNDIVKYTDNRDSVFGNF